MRAWEVVTLHHRPHRTATTPRPPPSRSGSVHLPPVPRSTRSRTRAGRPPRPSPAPGSPDQAASAPPERHRRPTMLREGRPDSEGEHRLHRHHPERPVRPVPQDDRARLRPDKSSVKILARADGVGVDEEDHPAHPQVWIPKRVDLRDYFLDSGFAIPSGSSVQYRDQVPLAFTPASRFPFSVRAYPTIPPPEQEHPEQQQEGVSV